MAITNRLYRPYKLITLLLPLLLVHFMIGFIWSMVSVWDFSSCLGSTFCWDGWCAEDGVWWTLWLVLWCRFRIGCEWSRLWWLIESCSTMECWWCSLWPWCVLRLASLLSSNLIIGNFLWCKTFWWRFFVAVVSCMMSLVTSGWHFALPFFLKRRIQRHWLYPPMLFNDVLLVWYISYWSN